MCKLVEIVRDAVPSNITIEFERDAAIRATSVFIINRKRNGEEGQGMRIICLDNGEVSGGVNLMEGVDII